MRKSDPHALVRLLVRSYLTEADDTKEDPNPDVGSDPDTYRGPTGKPVRVYKMSDFENVKWKIPSFDTVETAEEPAEASNAVFSYSSSDVMANPGKHGLNEPTRKFSPVAIPHPLGGSKKHFGIDLTLSTGTMNAPAIAVEAGTVKIDKKDDPRSEKAGPGNNVTIDLGSGIKVRYLHLESIGVEDNARVVKGDTIGLIGTTGGSTGPHLHFEVYKDGVAVDPEPYLTNASRAWIFPMGLNKQP